MTTFQALVYALVEGISEFLPISSQAHHILVPYVLNWQAPSGALLGALSLGAFLSVFIYFWHDWASMISCFLQVVFFRKRPMTLDERLPLFLGISTLPLILSSYYLGDRIREIEWTPILVAAILACVGLPIWFFDSINRKTKGMFDWNGLNAAVVGLVQMSAILPGWDPLSAVLVGAALLNFKREPAAKYAYFLTAPLLLIQAIKHLKDVNFQEPTPMPDLSWLSFGVALVVTSLVGLLVIGGFMKHIQQKGYGQYMIYRWILAAGTCGLFWIRNYGFFSNS